MNNAKKTATIENLTGGLDTFINATEIDDSATPDCENVIPTGKGGIKTRYGQSLHGGEMTATYAGQGYFTYINSSNATEELIVVNGVLKRKNGASWTTIAGGTLDTTARVFATQIGDRLYFADGVTALCYYNGTAIATTGVNSAPKPSFIISFNRRIYCNSVDYPDRFYFGGSIDSTTGDADDTGDFRSTTPAYGGYAGFGKGKIITGFGKLGASYLVVGVKDGLYRVAPKADTGASSTLSHSEEMISNSVGIASHATVDNIENDLGFLSWSDFYLLGEVASFSSIRTRVISTKISGLIQAISASRITKTAGLYSPTQKQYYLTYTESGTYNNAVLIFDTHYKSWWKFTGWTPAAWVEFVDENSAYYLNYISDNPSSSYCYQVEIGADDAGTAIHWYWYSKVFDLKGFDVAKKFKRWAVLFGPVAGVVTLTLYINDLPNTSTLTLGTATNSTTGFGCMPFGWKPYGQYTNDLGTVFDELTNDYRWKKIARPNSGTRIQFYFAGGALNESGQIEKIKIYYIENPNKKDKSKRIM